MMGGLNRVAGLVAIITGSGAGIGRATAEFFAEEGIPLALLPFPLLAIGHLPGEYMMLFLCTICIPHFGRSTVKLLDLHLL